jgi:hypothetical protein
MAGGGLQSFNPLTTHLPTTNQALILAGRRIIFVDFKLVNSKLKTCGI